MGYSILHRAGISVTHFLETIGVGLWWIVVTSITAARDSIDSEKANKVEVERWQDRDKTSKQQTTSHEPIDAETSCSRYCWGL